MPGPVLGFADAMENITDTFHTFGDLYSSDSENY